MVNLAGGPLEIEGNLKRLILKGLQPEVGEPIGERHIASLHSETPPEH